MNDLQRNEDWYLARKGKITASEIETIMHKGRKEDFSASAISYLKNAVAEQYMTDSAFLEAKEDERTPIACKWGTFWEDKAREAYEHKTGNHVLDAPFIGMLGYSRWAGGSPDGIIALNGTQTNGKNSQAHGIVEIKCPFQTAHHLEHYLYQSAEDLKADNPQYYAQVQMNMMIAGIYTMQPVTYCDFISYDPRVVEDKQLKILHVVADPEYQAELKERIELAVAWMEEYRLKIDQM